MRFLHPVASSPWASGAADSTSSARGTLRSWFSFNRSEPGHILSPDQARVFQEEDRSATLRNARLGAWTVIVLVPLCIILDYVAYPQHFWLFAGLRILCSLLCLPVLWMLKFQWAERFYHLFPIYLPVLAAFFISLMIYLTGEAHSSYYAGLNLCVVGTSFIFHWTFRETAITLGIVLALYFAATLPNLSLGTSPYERGIFVNNSIFLVLNCAILYVSCRQHYAIRVSEFLGRYVMREQHQELADRHTELRSTLDQLRSTEAQLSHSDRLASIGRLSAGIIHEINNPLNFVKSALYVLNKRLKTMPPEIAGSVSSITSDVSEGVDRVAAIVSDLRTFAHPNQRILHPVKVTPILAKAERFLAKDIQDRRIAFSIHGQPDLEILADDREVLQVLINLIQNSIDALQSRPSPSITIQAARDSEGQVSISVRDNGCGISPENAALIFDPFYTTKEVGKGMGLGLSICYRMMQQMQGDIEVESIAGEYTCFTLRFQSAPAPSPPRSLAQTPTHQLSPS